MDAVLRYSDVLHLDQHVRHIIGDTIVRTSRLTDTTVRRGPSGDQVEFVPELADQKNAGQSLVSSGSDCQREGKFVTKHDPAPPRGDRGGLKAAAASCRGQTG